MRAGLGRGASHRSPPFPGLRILVRLLPSRVGFAERDASRPAFGGSSLALPKSGTCVGGGPYGPRMSVRPSRYCPQLKKRARSKPRKTCGLREKGKKTGDFCPRPEDVTHCARRGRRPDGEHDCAVTRAERLRGAKRQAEGQIIVLPSNGCPLTDRPNGCPLTMR